jgi:hypothetical protein
MQTINVRLATPADLDTVAALFNGYRQFYEQPDDLGNSSVTTVLDGAGNQMLMPSRRS